MKFENVVIESIAYEFPPEVWSSEDVENKLAPLYERLKLPVGRLELMTGIRERRFWPQGTLPSAASAMAGEKVLQQSAFDRKEIEVIVHASVSRDRLEPATASYVHRQLGLSPDAQILDISNACLGFLNALIMVGGLIESGMIQRALIVCGENGRPLVERTIEQLLASEYTRNEIKPFFANLTIGAGAVAAVISHASLAPKNAVRVGAAIVETDTEANELCQGDSASGDALEMQTDSEQLLVAGVAVATRAWRKLKTETGWDESTPDRVVTHQVGKQHQRSLFQALGLDLAKDVTTCEILGNVGSVSLPITLARGLELNQIQPGDDVALLGIGSGLSSIMMTVNVPQV